MNNRTSKCPVCQNTCEVKESTGNKNPANKGKLYIMCPACPEGKQFHWVTPEETTPIQPELIREPVKQRDFDEEARGKIRSLFLEAYIGKNGMVVPSQAELVSLNILVEIAMTGKTGN